MNILILGASVARPTDSERAYYQTYVDFFTDSARTINAEVSVATAMFDDLLIEVGDGVIEIFDTHNERMLSEYDAFFFRGDKFRMYMDVIATITAYAQRHGIKTINDYSNVRDSSKLLQATHFEEIGVPVAKTLSVNSALLSNIDRIKDWQFPCIMKAVHGSHGNDNYIVNSLNEVREILTATPDKRFVLQRFVPNTGDFRILIIGDEVIIIGRSAQGGSHLNNTSKGGTATEVASDSLPPQVLMQAKAIADYYKMTIAGVDVLQDSTTGEYFFLEVNAQPQLMTGAFVDEKKIIIGKLLQKLKGE